MTHELDVHNHNVDVAEARAAQARRSKERISAKVAILENADVENMSEKQLAEHQHRVRVAREEERQAAIFELQQEGQLVKHRLEKLEFLEAISGPSGSRDFDEVVDAARRHELEAQQALHEAHIETLLRELLSETSVGATRKDRQAELEQTLANLRTEQERIAGELAWRRRSGFGGAQAELLDELEARLEVMGRFQSTVIESFDQGIVTSRRQQDALAALVDPKRFDSLEDALAAEEDRIKAALRENEEAAKSVAAKNWGLSRAENKLAEIGFEDRARQLEAEADHVRRLRANFDEVKDQYESKILKADVPERELSYLRDVAIDSFSDLVTINGLKMVYSSSKKWLAVARNIQTANEQEPRRSERIEQLSGLAAEATDYRKRAEAVSAEERGEARSAFATTAGGLKSRVIGKAAVVRPGDALDPWVRAADAKSNSFFGGVAGWELRNKDLDHVMPAFSTWRNLIEDIHGWGRETPNGDNGPEEE